MCELCGGLVASSGESAQKLSAFGFDVGDAEAFCIFGNLAHDSGSFRNGWDFVHASQVVSVEIIMVFLLVLTVQNDSSVTFGKDEVFHGSFFPSFARERLRFGLVASVGFDLRSVNSGDVGGVQLVLVSGDQAEFHRLALVNQDWSSVGVHFFREKE